MGLERRVVLLGIFGLAAVILSLSIAFGLEPKQLGWKVIVAAIAEIGFAALIAVFIIQTIDKHEKEKFRKEIASAQSSLAEYGFASYIAGVDVPNSVLARFGQVIGGEGVIKKHHQTTQTLEASEGGILMRHVAEYEAYNASKFPTEFNVPLYSGSDLRSGKIIASKKDKEGKWIEVGHVNLRDNSQVRELKGGKYPVALTQSLDPKEEIRVLVDLEIEAEISDSHLNSNPLNGLAHCVNVIYNPNDIEVGARLTSQFDYSKEERNNEDGTVTLILDHPEPFLRGSCTYVWWKPKKKAH